MFHRLEEQTRRLTHVVLARIHWPRRGLLISGALSLAGLILLAPDATVQLELPLAGLTRWARNDILSLWPCIFTTLVVTEMLLRDRGVSAWLLMAPTLWLVSALLLTMQLTLVVGVSSPWLWAFALTALFVPLPRARTQVAAS